MNVKLPSDIDLADRILWGLTARQLAILGTTCLGGWSIYVVLAALPYIALPVGGVVVAAGVAVAFTRPDGLMAEHWLLEGMRHLVTPRRRVMAPEGLPDIPEWANGRVPVGLLEMPLAGISADGVISLGKDMFSLVCRASALNLALRSEPERTSLIEGLGRFLNSIDSSLSFVVRSERSDIRGHLEEIEHGAGALPHPALEQAARSHVVYLRSLADRRDVARREVYLVFTTSAQDEHEAAMRLAARVDEAAGLLRGLGIRLMPLEGARALALIARACDPDAMSPDSQAGLPGDVVTGAIS